MALFTKDGNTIIKNYRKLVYRQSPVFIARYITVYIESLSGKLDLFRVTFLKGKFNDSIALVV